MTTNTNLHPPPSPLLCTWAARGNKRLARKYFYSEACRKFAESRRREDRQRATSAK